LFGYALAIVLLSIFAAIWAIARSSRNYRRYRGLCQKFRELQQGTYDQEFVSEEPEIEELNDMAGKPRPFCSRKQDDQEGPLSYRCQFVGYFGQPLRCQVAPKS
jgi:hypothetical protein